MPLINSSSTYLLRNISLILICIFFTPLATIITIFGFLISPFTQLSKHIKLRREWRKNSSATFRPRTILVTGVGMSKGLTLARAFYRSGHRVIGADFEPYFIPVPGHFSTSVDMFYRLRKLTFTTGYQSYIEDLISIISKEKIELWISCSGVATAIEDGHAAMAIEERTSCKALQFGPSTTEMLHEKHSFIAHAKKIDLNVPSTTLITSEIEALNILYSSTLQNLESDRKYIMKPLGNVDSLRADSLRADMTLLPLSTLSGTETHIRNLNPTLHRPFILQEYISGREYCTQSLIVDGKVPYFVACPSSELLMHYIALPSTSSLSLAMYQYTLLLAQKSNLGAGHLSLHFMVPEELALEAERSFGASEEEVTKLMGKLYPLECNPRVHTAIVLFADESEEITDTYLSILPSCPSTLTNHIIVPKPSTPGYYWLSNDLITLFFLPILHLIHRTISFSELLKKWGICFTHLLFWRDGFWESWDPMPWWWGIVGYWPLTFGVCVWEGKWWGRVNVSTLRLLGEMESFFEVGGKVKGGHEG